MDYAKDNNFFLALYWTSDSYSEFTDGDRNLSKYGLNLPEFARIFETGSYRILTGAKGKYPLYSILTYFSWHRITPII